MQGDIKWMHLLERERRLRDQKYFYVGILVGIFFLMLGYIAVRIADPSPSPRCGAQSSRKS